MVLVKLSQNIGVKVNKKGFWRGGGGKPGLPLICLHIDTYFSADFELSMTYYMLI